VSITVAIVGALALALGAAAVWFALRQAETVSEVNASPDGAPFQMAFATRGPKRHVLRVDLAWRTDAAPSDDPDVPSIEVEVEICAAETGGFRAPSRTLLASTLTSEPDRGGYRMQRLGREVRVWRTHVLSTLPLLAEGTGLEIRGRVSKVGDGTYERVRVFVTAA
jgi:hypothetical protein